MFDLEPPSSTVCSAVALSFSLKLPESPGLQGFQPKIKAIKKAVKPA
jgi:hypothetical protein